MIKIKLLLSLLFIGFSAYAAADEDIIIKTADGNSVSSLQGLKCMRFDGDVMLLDMKDGSSKSWSTDDIDRITFTHTGSGNTNSIWGVTAAVTYKSDNKYIVINSRNTLFAWLYTINGKVVHYQACCGESLIDVSHLPAGVYILNVNGETYKIVKR